MNRIGGIEVYGTGETISFPEGVPTLPKGARSRYGFKLVERNGQQEWVEAEESDFRGLLEKIGLDEQAITSTFTQQRNLGSSIMCQTNGAGTACVGSCIGPGSCSGYFDGRGGVYGCHCG